jgi:hypothetical protein
VKFNEARNQEIKIKKYSWEKKKTLRDVLENSQKQTIQVNQKNNLLEEYLKRNPGAKVNTSKTCRK